MIKHVFEQQRLNIMYPQLIEQLIERLVKLPGIGRRGAERIVFWMLDQSKSDVLSFSKSITDLKEGLRFCPVSNNLTQEDVCPITKDQSRDRTTICIVESPKDVIAIEKMGTYRGQYFVLLSTISPSDGRGPDDLNLGKLFNRIRSEGIREVVVATDADAEGEMTALHLSKVLKPLGVRICRIGVGLPMGGSVEFADLSTLSMSFNARREMVDQS